MDTDANGVRSRSRRRQVIVHVVWTILVVAAAAFVLLSIASTRPKPGQCEGIGWGCNLYGGDAAFFAAFFVVPIALALVLVGNAIIAFLGWLVRKPAHRFPGAGIDG
jgi:hypothetical protein